MKCKFCHIQIRFHFNQSTNKKTAINMDGQIHRCLGNVHRIKQYTGTANHNNRIREKLIQRNRFSSFSGGSGFISNW